MNTRWVRLGLAAICGLGLAVLPAQAETNELPVAAKPDGSLSVPGQAEVPACGTAGKWAELPGKSSERYLTRHFMFLVPNEAPAMELYLTHDRSGEKPDGVFEMGLVGGYVKGFAGKAGYEADNVAFEDCTVGGVKAKRCQVKLTRDQRSLFVYAYVFVRQTSLIFLTVRSDPNARASIERYLGTIRFR